MMLLQTLKPCSAVFLFAIAVLIMSAAAQTAGTGGSQTSSPNNTISVPTSPPIATGSSDGTNLQAGFWNIFALVGAAITASLYAL